MIPRGLQVTAAAPDPAAEVIQTLELQTEVSRLQVASSLSPSGS